jgi:hypothetical protein
VNSHRLDHQGLDLDLRLFPAEGSSTSPPRLDQPGNPNFTGKAARIPSSSRFAASP